VTRRLTVAIETLGCKLNLADSELLARDFSRLGFEIVDSADPEPDEGPDVFIVNTCTVTHVADRKARQQLRSAHRRFPDAYIVATGCYPARAQAEDRRSAGAACAQGSGSPPRAGAAQGGGQGRSTAA